MRSPFRAFRPYVASAAFASACVAASQPGHIILIERGADGVQQQHEIPVVAATLTMERGLAVFRLYAKHEGEDPDPAPCETRDARSPVVEMRSLSGDLTGRVPVGIEVEDEDDDSTRFNAGSEIGFLELSDFNSSSVHGEVVTPLPDDEPWSIHGSFTARRCN